MKGLLCLLSLSVACGGPSTPDDTWRPDLVCPGDAGCAASDDVILQAGAATKSIEPSCYESWRDVDGDLVFGASDVFLDCGCDRLCPDDPGYPGADEGEGDGVFTRIYMGGGDANRPLMGVRDPALGLRGVGDGVYANVVALRQGETTVAIVALDTLGLQYDDTLAVRALAAERGVDVDHILVHSTHTHTSVDNIGLWGRSITSTGYDAGYHEELRGVIVDTIVEALAAMVPVDMVIGEVDVASYSAEKGVANVIVDTRDPFVIDNTLGAAELIAADGHAVATLVSFGMHPEGMLGDTASLSSGFPHALRETVESGVTWETRSREGLGGTCVFLNSTVGGMMTDLHVTTTDPDGHDWGSGASWEKVDAIGQQLGEMALDAVEGGELVRSPTLSVRTTSLYIPVENFAFQATFLLGVFPRSLYHYDADQPLDDNNLPDIHTEVDLLQLGPLTLLALPGEILPELAIGGYDGSRVNAPGHNVIDEANPINPPDLSAAPGPPYLKDRLSTPHRWVVGLANDEIGYVIPEYNFVLRDTAAYVFEAEGDHYEETRSLGPTTASRLESAVAQLAAWAP